MIYPKTYALYQKLYKAYFSARKNKRNKRSQLCFEWQYEQEIDKLYNEIVHYAYEPSAPNVFVTTHPVVREIFAPQFRDRVVHHLIYNYIYQYLDKKFIYDSYSCRLQKGTSFGVKRAAQFMRRVSENYTKDAYVLKLDIRGYFMQMNRNILHEKINQMLDYEALKITNTERVYLQYLIRKVVMHDAARRPRLCASPQEWKKVPCAKSLFHAPPNCGLPIGSLTSQLFSNVYLNELDHFVKSELKIKYYGRYVDDMLFMHRSKDYLQQVIDSVACELHKIGLSLHPQKIKLKHYKYGVKFLGRYLLPGRIYLSNRCKKQVKNFQAKFCQDWENAQVYVWQVINPINSYLGILSEHNTYRLKQEFVEKLPQSLYYYYHLEDKGSSCKLSLNKEYNPKYKYALVDL